MRLWCRVRTIAGHDAATESSVVIAGAGEPDLAAVDELARVLLGAKQLGSRLVIEDLAPELAELLDLAGLDLTGLQGVEVQRQAERREEPHRVQGVEEKSELGDPSL
jgi:hypothetical protein